MNKKEFDYNKTGIVFGIIGLLVLPLLFGIVAVCFGAISKGKGEKKNGAIILGALNLGVWVIQVYLI